jgi:hypothetical protein
MIRARTFFASVFSGASRGARPLGTLRPIVAFGALAGFAAAVVGASCSPNSVCKLAGPINDPSNRTLRRSIMSFGLGQFCEQMVVRNAPLKLAPDASVVGRFFPQHCMQQVLDNGDLWVHLDGIGYAFINPARRVGFASGATIQYNQDFKCADDNSIYAYFDTRSVTQSSFDLRSIEQPVANLVQGWIKPFADSFGQQMVSGKVAQGFTVIQGDDGSVDFDLGHLPLASRPVHPMQLHGSNRQLWESQRTEVHTGERDYVGPIVVPDGNRAIYLTMKLDGQSAVAVLLVTKADGDASLDGYVRGAAIPVVANAPRFSDQLVYAAPYERAVPVPAGMYYLVIDNTTPPGVPRPVLPAPLGLIDGEAVVSYAIQIGDAP